MEYKLPTLKNEKDIEEYLQEHFLNGEHDIIICQDLFIEDSIKWVCQMQKNACNGNDDWGKSLLLLSYDNSRLIGILCIRYDLTQELQAKYGNIGYSVRPSERKKGYATQMLQYALKVCKEKGMTRVILGCHSDNIASASVIKKCGGILIDTVEESTEIINYFFEIKI